jgi:dipeptidyl aminopeptidase/acylaminoacyl peptidase
VWGATVARGVRRPSWEVVIRPKRQPADWVPRHIPCLLLAIFASLPCGAAKKRFTVADDIGMVLFRQPFSEVRERKTFSPNGFYFFVHTERGRLDINRPESTLAVFRTEDVRQFLLNAELTCPPSPIWTFKKATFQDGPIIADIRWLADSRGLAFLAKNESGNDQLYLADPKQQTALSLTPADQHVTGFDIRDRHHYVYSVQSSASRERANEESRSTSIVGTGRPLSNLLFPLAGSKQSDLSELWAVKASRRFRVEDKFTKQALSVYLTGQRALALSPDGSFLVTALALSTIPPDWERLYPAPSGNSSSRITAGKQDLEAFAGTTFVSEYVLIDLARGVVKRLTTAPIGNEAGWVGFAKADWSPDGQLVVLSNTFLPPSVQGSDEHASRPCIAVIDLVKRDLSCVERMEADDENGYRLIENVYFDRNTNSRVVVEYEVSNPTEGVVQGATSYLRSADGSWTAINPARGSIESDLPIEVSVRQSLNDPPVLVATDETNGNSRIIWNPNRGLQDVDLGEASVFKWKDRSGRAWIGGLYKPPDYVQGLRYPLVIQTHGFAPSYFVPSGIFSSAFAARELAATGMLVLQVQDCPYSVTEGEGPCNVSGYEAAIEQLVAEGLADPDAVGIVGFSRTCYYVLEALTAGKMRFKAASVTDGVNAGYLQYVTNVDLDGNQMAREYDAMIGARPYGEGLMQWVRRSPVFNMDKVTTPLQVVAAGHSGVLFMWEPYAALRYLNKPVDLIVLNTEEHVLTNPAARMVSQGGTVDWMRFWLQKYEDPDPKKKEQYVRWRELRKMVHQNEAVSTPGTEK